MTVTFPRKSVSQSPPNFNSSVLAFRMATRASLSWLLVVILSSLMRRVREGALGAPPSSPGLLFASVIWNVRAEVDMVGGRDEGATHHAEINLSDGFEAEYHEWYDGDGGEEFDHFAPPAFGPFK
jgi:hypothetical protein